MSNAEQLRRLFELAEKEGLSPEEIERLIRNDDHFGLGQSSGPGHISLPGLGGIRPKRPMKKDLNASSGDNKKKKPSGEDS
tara:strand:- start:43631 stop:43873 length:243 start_codon:yes stop_codon:yes gene_type:complete